MAVRHSLAYPAASYGDALAIEFKFTASPGAQ